MPTTSFLPQDLANDCLQYLSESWVNRTPDIVHSFIGLVYSVFSEIALIDFNFTLGLPNPNIDPNRPLWIHIYHNFDAEGNRLHFRRIDFFHALYTWLMRVMEREVDRTATEGFYQQLTAVLREVEVTLEPERDWRPVRCVLLEGPVYTNGTM